LRIIARAGIEFSTSRATIFITVLAAPSCEYAYHLSYDF
jgi:hypothetical protein